MKTFPLLMLALFFAPLSSFAQEPRNLGCKLNLTTQANGVTNSIDVLHAQAPMPTTLRKSDGVFTYQVTITPTGAATIDLASTAGDRMNLQMSIFGIRRGNETIAGSTFGLKLKAPIPYRDARNLTQVTAATLVCSRNP
jgi:hypothetical protein